MPFVARSLVAVLALVVAPAVTFAQPGIPQSPPPAAGRVIIHDGQLLATQTFTRWIPETRTRTVTVNGQQEEQTYTVMRPVMEQKNQQVIGGHFRVMTVGGERFTDEEAAEKLSAATDVLISTSGKLLDPAYRDLYLPETLIVYLRAGMVCEPAAAPPPPPPPPAEGSAPPPPVEVPAIDQPPPPQFPEAPISKGPPPVIGLAVNPVFDGNTTADDKVRLSVLDWRMVMEQKPVEVKVADENGTMRKVMKMQVVHHWLSQGRWTDVPLAELPEIDRQGKPLPTDARAKLKDGEFPVLLMNPGVPFDADHFQHFRPEVPIIQAELPPSEGQPFPNMLPPHETFAQVKGDWLFVFKPVFEQRVVKIPITVIKEGKPATAYEEKFEIVTRFVGEPYPLKTGIHVKAADAAGKAVDATALAARLAKESPVLISHHGAIGDIYFAPVKPDTLALELTHWAPGPEDAGNLPPAAPALESSVGGPAPRFALARLHQPSNLLVLREPQPSTAQFQKQVSKTVEGKVFTETVIEQRVVTHWHEHAISAENYRLTGIDGQSLAGELAFGRLNKETMILIGDQGKKVDPTWLSICKPNTVIVYLRHSGYGMAAPPPVPVAPAPPPPPPPGGAAPAEPEV